MKANSANMPKKLIIRRILESSGLRLNSQIWIPAKNCFDNLYEAVTEQAIEWPNVVVSTALMKENEAGGSPLTKPEKPEVYKNKNILVKTLKDLEMRCKEYNGVGFCENDWIRLFSSPLGINHLLVGVSAHFDVYPYFYGDGDCRPTFMPVVIEAQQGTWPRYFNISKSEETRKSFCTAFQDRPYGFWKQSVIKGNPSGIVEKALSDSFSYFSSTGVNMKIFCLAQEMRFSWIGFDAQYIAENSDGYQEGFRIFDFNGF